ncbi:peroxiredoxin [Actinomycetospora endophytica]|uniref:Glutathione-dependent peroxiredoxin n=1 Tax=Actinomycetospora endophytica TaxID=2291215 RepID=A0ABS8PH06_9PSEU|nr:peroxiredoxin [Actinomycetospora endophytica]MCD2197551.1 peroxiredoxin [Actinomycetospora endophytica]
MTISVGEKVPDVPLKAISGGEVSDVRTGELLGTGRVVLFGVPAAFSPTCSDAHLPGFVMHAAELADKGVSKIFCLSVNDFFVMQAWAASQHADDIVMLADSAAAFTTAMGLEVDTGDFGLGVRSQRYSAVIEDGVITSLDVEAGLPDHDVSSAENVLTKL